MESEVLNTKYGTVCSGIMISKCDGNSVLLNLNLLEYFTKSLNPRRFNTLSVIWLLGIRNTSSNSWYSLAS